MESIPDSAKVNIGPCYSCGRHEKEEMTMKELRERLSEFSKSFTTKFLLNPEIHCPHCWSVIPIEIKDAG